VDNAHRRVEDSPAHGRAFGRRATDSAARVLVVDDHLAVSQSLALAIDMQPDLTCIAAVSTVAEAERVAREQRPDILLTDVRLPDGDGIEASLRIRESLPSLRVLVLTAHIELTVMARAATSGVCGFLPKESSVAEILGAVRAARDGGMIVDRTTLSAVLTRIRRDRQEAVTRVDGSLTRREVDVLAALGQGQDPQTIARSLGISVNTCRGYVKNILAKLGAHSQLEAVVIALRRGLLPELLDA
jgi:DNA-binding NarL/FixJ family response regulator